MVTHVFYNPTAGDGEWHEERLARLFRTAGFEAECVSVKEESWERALRAAGPPVFVAGGDGTVERVACEILRRDLPIVILPTGGANNTNRWLGGGADPEAVVRAWVQGSLQSLPLHVCRAHGANGSQCFIESVGVGALPRSIPAAKEMPGNDKVAKGRDALRRCLESASLVRCGFSLDGEPIEEDVLMVEILNTGMVGPRLLLRASASGTGEDLVVTWLPAGAREQMIEWLEAPEEAPSPLQRRGATRAELHLSDEDIHVADDVLEGLSGTVAVERVGKVSVLVPGKGEA